VALDAGVMDSQAGTAAVLPSSAQVGAVADTLAGASTPARPLSPARELSPARQLISDYVELTKPKVQSLLLLTTITTMYVAGDPSPLLVALTCLGGYLSAGGAGAVNHWFDRDIDAQMARTATRPIPAGRVSPRAALTFGCTLAVLSLLELSLTVNPLAAGLSFTGFLGYVFVYTLWLKRRTPQNIVIGGAAGAIPPLVGWAAVTGSVGGLAVILFFIVFFWTPPHFWALSLLMKDEYRKVGVPMLPVVRGEAETRRQILLYTVLLYAVTQLPFCTGALGGAYLAASLVLGVGFIAGAVRLYRRADRRSALQLYLFSLAYLALLFVAMVVDTHL
jgi:heme o synthase